VCYLPHIDARGARFGSWRMAWSAPVCLSIRHNTSYCVKKAILVEMPYGTGTLQAEENDL